MIIKLLLIAAMAGAAFYLIRGRQTAFNLLVRRALILVILAAGVVAVIAPSAVTDVANLVGVGRGADLVLYLLSVTFLFVSIGLNLRLAQVNDRLADLARKHAHLQAEVEKLSRGEHDRRSTSD